MLCAQCGAETPDDSSYCVECGSALPAPSSADAAASEQDSGHFPDEASQSAQPESAMCELGEEVEFEILLDDDPPERVPYPQGFYRVGPVASIYQSFEDEPLVDPPSGPGEMVLGKGPVAVIALISALFGVAIMLLASVIVMRMLGL